MTDWIWYVLTFVGLVSAYAVLGSHVGGLFGPYRPDKADTHTFSDRGLLIRKIALILLGLLGLYAVVDYVAFEDSRNVPTFSAWRCPSTACVTTGRHGAFRH
jgi:hypothetical protein